MESFVISEKDLTSFPIDRVVDNSVTDFDLYLNISGEYILYGGEGYHWQRDELERLLRNGYQNFHIKMSDQKRADMYRQLTLLPQINKDLEPKERIKSLEQVGAAFTKCLYEGVITPACVEKAQTICTAIIECLREDHRVVQELSGLGDYDYYTYYHSIRVATYATATAIELGLLSEEQLKSIALGGIFHDIGKKEVPIEILNKVGPLTDREWQAMRNHPKLGYNSVLDTALGLVPREIILHHHEKLDGSGYPDGLDGKSLIYEVQIATLADVYDALTSTRCYQQKRSRYQALDFIKHKMLGKEIPIEPFKALINCLVK